MSKFIITEEDKKLIRGLYGLNEQTITLPLPISDTFQSYDGDSAHKLTGLETKIDRALEQIYNQGINPKMYDVKLKVVRNGNTYTTTSSLTIDKSDDGKAWTGFASRGSIGYEYVSRADGQIDGSGNADGRSLEEKLKSGADAVEIIPISNSPITINNVELKQYFVQFTKSKKSSHTSSQPTPQPTQPTPKEFVITKKYLDNTKSNNKTIVVKTTKLDDLYPKFKNEVSNYITSEGNKNYSVVEFDLTSEDKINATAKLNIVPNEKGFNKFLILLNPEGESSESLNKVLEKNLDSEKIKSGTIVKDNELKPKYEWHLVGLHV